MEHSVFARVSYTGSNLGIKIYIFSIHTGGYPGTVNTCWSPHNGSNHGTVNIKHNPGLVK
jgi:hypothetical protein